MRNIKIKYGLYRLPILIFFSIFISCAPPAKEIGTWQKIDDKGTIEFKKDGTFIVVDNMGTISIGNYSITENTKLQMEITGTNILRDSLQPVASPEIIHATIAITQDALHLSYKNESEKYRRIK